MAIDDLEIMKQNFNKKVNDLKCKGYSDEMIEYILNIEESKYWYVNR